MATVQLATVLPAGPPKPAATAPAVPVAPADLSQQLRDPIARLQAEIAELQDTSAQTRFIYLATHHRSLARYPRSATAALRELTRTATSTSTLLPPRVQLDLHTGSTIHPEQRLLQFHAHCPSFRFLALWRSKQPMTRSDVDRVEHAIQAVLLAVKQPDGKVARRVSPDSQQWVRGITHQHARDTMQNYLNKEHGGQFVPVLPPTQAPTLLPPDSSDDDSSSEDEADEPLLASSKPVVPLPSAAAPPRSSPTPTSKPAAAVAPSVGPGKTASSNGSASSSATSSSHAGVVRQSTPTHGTLSRLQPSNPSASPPAPAPAATTRPSTSASASASASSSSKSPAVVAPISGSRRIPKRVLPPPPAPTGPRPIAPPSKKPKPSN